MGAEVSPVPLAYIDRSTGGVGQTWEKKSKRLFSPRGRDRSQLARRLFQESVPPMVRDAALGS